MGEERIDEQQLASLLNEKVDEYERPEFIGPDPISIPHRYSRRQDIEIAGVLSSTIAWGNRRSIVQSGERMMEMLGDSPYDFVMTASDKDIERLSGFVYRTFQQSDLPGFIRGLRGIYSSWEGEDALERLFVRRKGETDLRPGLIRFRSAMIAKMEPRSHKHIADVSRGAAAKRLCMFLSWMVRSSARGVDFGIWRGISPRELMMPLDVHVGNVGRALGLIRRRQNDWKTAVELTEELKRFCAEDPVRYDYALFSLGIVEHLT